jgi:carbohydrate-selective porin OprB
MSLGSQLRAYKAKAVGNLDAIVGGTVEAASERVLQLSPVGAPETWQHAPGADYRPGNFKGNWFYATNVPTTATHDGVGTTTINGLSQMPTNPAGLKHFVSNSLEYAQALEYGHSSQSPAGIIAVLSAELTTIAEGVAKERSR